MGRDAVGTPRPARLGAYRQRQGAGLSESRGRERTSNATRVTVYSHILPTQRERA